MYVALTKDDTTQFRAVTTSDFHSYDGGKKFAGDELMTLIKGLHATGKTFVWTVPEPTGFAVITVGLIGILGRRRARTRTHA